jgi:hypothetical protein
MFLFFDAKYERTIADARHTQKSSFLLGLKQRDTASSQNEFLLPSNTSSRRSTLVAFLKSLVLFKSTMSYY